MIQVIVLREIWRITERRNGAVYKTKYIEDVWIPIEEPRPLNDPDLFYNVKSMSYEGVTIKSIVVKDVIPEVNS